LDRSFSISTLSNQGVRFKTIKIDIHQGVIKIVDGDILYDFRLNNIASVIVGRDRKQVLARTQRGAESIQSIWKFNKECKVLDYDITSTEDISDANL